MLSTKDKKLALHVVRANTVLNSPIFYHELEIALDEAGFSGGDIAYRLERLHMVSNIEAIFYRTKWPWSAARARFQRKRPDKVQVNKWAFKDSPEDLDWKDTLIHEFTHVFEYHHDGNSKHGNEDTVPYIAGRVAGEVYARLL